MPNDEHAVMQLAQNRLIISRVCSLRGAGGSRTNELQVIQPDSSIGSDRRHSITIIMHEQVEKGGRVSQSAKCVTTN